MSTEATRRPADAGQRTPGDNMTGVWRMWVWLLAGVMACMAQAGAAPPAAAMFVPVAHSAQLTLETSSTPTELTLHLQRTQGTTPLAVTDLSIAIDGRSAPVTRLGEDTWSASWPSQAARGGKIEVVVTHDGIREVLSGMLAPAPGGAATGAADAGRMGGLLGAHKQLAWWILNITVVLIAAIAISRRTS